MTTIIHQERRSRNTRGSLEWRLKKMRLISISLKKVLRRHFQPLGNLARVLGRQFTIIISLLKSSKKSILVMITTDNFTSRNENPTQREMKRRPSKSKSNSSKKSKRLKSKWSSSRFSKP
jgi:hypothetical protein